MSIRSLSFSFSSLQVSPSTNLFVLTLSLVSWIGTTFFSLCLYLFLILFNYVLFYVPSFTLLQNYCTGSSSKNEPTIKTPVLDKKQKPLLKSSMKEFALEQGLDRCLERMSKSKIFNSQPCISLLYSLIHSNNHCLLYSSDSSSCPFWVFFLSFFLISSVLIPSYMQASFPLSKLAPPNTPSSHFLDLMYHQMNTGIPIWWGFDLYNQTDDEIRYLSILRCYS